MIYAIYEGTQNGYGEADFKLYTVYGGRLNLSTVSEQTINDNNIIIGNPTIVMRGY